MSTYDVWMESMLERCEFGFFLSCNMSTDLELPIVISPEQETRDAIGYAGRLMHRVFRANCTEHIMIDAVMLIRGILLVERKGGIQEIYRHGEERHDKAYRDALAVTMAYYEGGVLSVGRGIAAQLVQLARLVLVEERKDTVEVCCIHFLNMTVTAHEKKVLSKVFPSIDYR
jgi:hypothetical protein